MKPYADSNFFTKFYLVLPDSELASKLMAIAAEGDTLPLPITWLHRLEVVNALQLQVFSGRMHGQSRITPEQASIAQASFRHDLGRSDFLRSALLSHDQVLNKFEDISLRHTARHGFRTYDIVHVASALLLECDTFWSFDKKAARLAKLEGLKVQP